MKCAINSKNRYKRRGAALSATPWRLTFLYYDHQILAHTLSNLCELIFVPAHLVVLLAAFFRNYHCFEPIIALALSGVMSLAGFPSSGIKAHPSVLHASSTEVGSIASIGAR